MTEPWRAVSGTMMLSALFGCGQPDGVLNGRAGSTTATEPSQAGEWVISEQPSLVIGSETGGEALQLYRVEDARRLQDGRILVSNAGTQKIRVFDSAGAFLFAFGGRGAGPGEFGSGSYLTLAVFGDTLLVDDHRNGRVQLFDGHGQFIRAIPLTGVDGNVLRFAGRLRDGRLLAWSSIGFAGMEGADGERVRPHREYMLVDPESGGSTVFDTVPSRSRVVNWYGELHDVVPVPFEIESSVVSDRATVLIGDHNAAHIERLDEDGQLVGVMEWAPPRIPSRDEVARYQSHVIEGGPDQLSGFWNSFFDKDLPLPDHLPVIAKILISEDEDVWVQRFRPAWVQGAQWDVLSNDGSWITTVVPPGDLEILQVGSNELLGVRTDSIGVEQVVVHSLSRPFPN